MTSTNTASFVYVGNSDSQDVSVFRLNADGTLTPVETVAVPGPDKPGAVPPPTPLRPGRDDPAAHDGASRDDPADAA